MKRRPSDESSGGNHPIAHEGPSGDRAKKPRSITAGEEEEGDAAVTPPPPDLGEDLVFEVLKRADARTLAAAACVSHRWRRLAEDERLWEAVCVRHWANIGCGGQQLRAVVLALGGFRRLHSLYLLPLLSPSSSSSSSFSSSGASAAGAASSSAAPLQRRAARLPARWGKDEVQLSLSLLSIGFFEKMNGFNYKPRGGGCG
ncbi:F-box protein GID2 [Typha latifolia]|uniref:F-box protein GID2 n=1 Tax=Typha latifolia TaxID=4733 RepID=UPI003C304C69